MSNVNHCSIFFFEGYVGVSPTIINLVYSLQNRDYNITIFARENTYESPKDLGDKVVVKYFKTLGNIFFISIFIKLLTKHKKHNLFEFLDSIFWFFQVLLYILLCKVKTKELFIGIDTYGAITAFLVKKLFSPQIKLAFLSLELNPPRTLFTRLINRLEKIAFKESICLLIQDEDRYKTICEYNQYNHRQYFLIPNSPICQNVKSSDHIKGNFFREKFKLDESEFPYLVVQAGMLDDNVFSRELALAFSNFQDINRYSLIFHERQTRSEHDPYIQEIKKINSKNLFLSLTSVPFNEVSNIFTSTTIGLVFYRNVDENFSEIAMASGKLSTCLKFGKPVLVNNLDSLSRLVDKYEFGIVINNPSNYQEIYQGLNKIIDNYEFYCQNAKNCFLNEFEVETKVNLFLDFVQKQETTKEPNLTERHKR